MQLQRIQTLFLFLSTALMIVFICCVPVATFEPIGIKIVTRYVFDIIPLVILPSVVTLLLVIDVFMYKNLKLQMTICNLCFWLTLAEALLLFVVLYWKVPSYATAHWVAPMSTLFATCVLIIWAHARMNHDKQLLRSADRLR